MQCPVCEGVDLAMSNREGIEIDYCPKCRGVWLDRGELDKIIERSAPAVEPAQPTYQDNHRPDPDYKEKYYSSDKYASDKYGNRDYYKRKKKKSLLGELFDF